MYGQNKIIRGIKMKITKINEYKFKVAGKTNDYTVIYRKDKTWFCTCKAFQYQANACKHIDAVIEWINSEDNWSIQGKIDIIYSRTKEDNLRRINYELKNLRKKLLDDFMKLVTYEMSLEKVEKIIDKRFGVNK